MLNYPSLQQFTQFVELKDLRAATRSNYVRYIRRLGDHFQADPAGLSEAQLREYLLFLRQVKKWGPSALYGVRFACRCFFVECLKTGAAWTVFADFKVRRPRRLPVILARNEVAQLLGAIRSMRVRTCLRLIYHCGLRLGEAVGIEVTDIRSALGRLHLRDTKGGQERYVPISPAMIEELRAFWKTHRHARWLFPAPHQGRPMNRAVVQQAVQMARAELGLSPKVTPHTLRHCYATHLLEEGVSLRLISQFLGHRSLDTTAIYTHLTATTEEHARQALERLHQALGR